MEEALALRRSYPEYVQFRRSPAIAMRFGSSTEVSSLSIEFVYLIADVVLVYTGYVVPPDVPILAGFAWQRYWRMAINAPARTAYSTEFKYQIELKQGTALPWLPLPRKNELDPCLLYTSPSPRDGLLSRMPSSA